MNLEVLISTMNIKTKEDNENLINKMNINGKSLTISQTDKTGHEEGKNRVIYDNRKGLSKSRNIALKNTDADIVLLADDDVIYEENYKEIVKKAYKENPDADMIAFYVRSLNDKRKTRKLKTGKLGWVRIFKVSSFQLSFKRNSINNMQFDENFGAGTKNYCGEETIFLSDCLRKGLKLIYVDEKIGEVEQKESSWYNGFNKELILVEKECFKRIAPKIWWVLWIQFIIRKGIKSLLTK